MEIEREIKFRLSPAAARRLGRLVRFAVPPRRREVVSVYYDTRRERLRRAGVALRLRRDGRRWLQTLKGEPDAHAGLAERAEWEVPVRHRRLDLDSFPREAIMAATGVDLRRLGGKLHALFETRFTRRSGIVALDGGGRAEISVDRGRVAAGRRHEPIHELELELKAGGPRPMLRLAEQLAEPLALEIEFESKAARGYRLASDHPAESPHRWHRPALHELATPGEAFPALFSAALAQAGANARGVVHSSDPEFLHQMRVGLRRLRSVLRAFRSMVPPQSAKPVVRPLRKLIPPLSAGRDWDVFCEWLAGAAARGPEGAAGLRELLARARRRRTAARRAARAAVSRPAFQRFLLRALRWLHGAPWSLRAAARDIPLAEHARDSLERLHRKALRQARGIDWHDTARRHALRIRIKRLRYACEFFAPCFPRASVRPYLKRLQALQDILGELNDVAVARRLVSELAPRGSAPEIAVAAARARRILAAREQALIASLEPAWGALEKRRRFWRGHPRESIRAAA